MSETQTNCQWDEATRAKFDEMIKRIPLFHREIARIVALKKAEINAQERGSAAIEEPDVVKAFFTEVPPAFYSLMIKLLGDVGFDYKTHEPK